MRIHKTLTKRGAVLQLITAFLSALAAIVYLITYSGTPYFHAVVGVLPLVGTAVFLALFVFHKPKLSALALFLGDFSALMLFFRYTYLYLSEVFFDGITLSALGAIKTEFIVVTFSLLLGVILANVALYVSPTGTKEARREEK